MGNMVSLIEQGFRSIGTNKAGLNVLKKTNRNMAMTEFRYADSAGNILPQSINRTNYRSSHKGRNWHSSKWEKYDNDRTNLKFSYNNVGNKTNTEMWQSDANHTINLLVDNNTFCVKDSFYQAGDVQYKIPKLEKHSGSIKFSSLKEFFGKYYRF